MSKGTTLVGIPLICSFFLFSLSESSVFLHFFLYFVSLFYSFTTPPILFLLLPSIFIFFLDHSFSSPFFPSFHLLTLLIHHQSIKPVLCAVLAQGTDNTFPVLRSSAAAGRERSGNKQAKPAVSGLDSSQTKLVRVSQVLHVLPWASY